jgi:hypothetical protein
MEKKKFLVVSLAGISVVQALEPVAKDLDRMDAQIADATRMFEKEAEVGQMIEFRADGGKGVETLLIMFVRLDPSPTGLLGELPHGIGERKRG